MDGASDLLRDDLEVHGAGDEVDDEEQHEGDDDALVHGIADALGPPARREPLVRGDDRGDGSEEERLDLASHEVGDLGKGGEAGEIGARCAALDDDVEEVATGDADDADQAVEQHRDQHRREHAGHDEPMDRADPEHLHRVDLLADLARAEVGADGRATRAGDEQAGDDRARLADDGEHTGGAGERLRAELPGEGAQLERDDRAERDGDEGRRHDRHRGDEPALLDELLGLERPAQQGAQHVEGEREEAAGLPETVGHHAHEVAPAVVPCVASADVGAWTPESADARVAAYGPSAGTWETPGTPAFLDWKEPGGGVTPWVRHHSPAGFCPRRGEPSLVPSWSAIGGSGGSSWPISEASSSASFSSDMPIGPMVWALRNWRTTGSSDDSSISRGPNIARCLWKSRPMLSGTVRAVVMSWVTIRNVASICALRSMNSWLMNEVRTGSRPESGSSISRISGSRTRARAR